jgi:hypothetical protein
MLIKLARDDTARGMWMPRPQRPDRRREEPNLKSSESAECGVDRRNPLQLVRYFFLPRCLRAA